MIITKETDKTAFDILAEEVQRGLEGKNRGIEMGFARLSKYISIKKRIYSALVAGTGLGKTGLLHNMFILNPYDWSISQQNTSKTKFKVILVSMERGKLYTIAKWLSRKIFLEQGVLIPVAKLLGWWNEKLSLTEHDYFLFYKPYIDEMLETKAIDIIEGNQNPTGIYRYIKNYAESTGRIEEIDEWHKVYIPNDESQITIVAADHMSLIRREKGLNTKKEAIDKLSEYFQWMRDFLGYSPIAVMQQNSSIANPMYLKSGEAEPTLEHAKDSQVPLEDSDLVCSLFNPRRYNQSDVSGYDLDKFIDTSNGAFYYRSLKILKSTYSESDIRCGLAFHGVTGTFKELPKVKDMDTFNYNSLFTGDYFLK